MRTANLKQKGPRGGPDEGRPTLTRARVAPAAKARRAPSEPGERVYLRGPLSQRMPHPTPYPVKGKRVGPVPLAAVLGHDDTKPGLGKEMRESARESEKRQRERARRKRQGVGYNFGGGEENAVRV